MFKRRRFGRRSHGRRRRISFKRASITFGYVNIAERAVAANTTETITLVSASDSPTIGQEANATVSINVENNSRIFPRVHVEVAATGSPGNPIPVAVLLWKDSPFGGLADPTTAQDVLQASDTANIKILKANKCMYIQKFLTTQGDRFSFRLRIPRRLCVLRDSESLKITVSNLQPATDSITWMASGAFKVLN